MKFTGAHLAPTIIRHGRELAGRKRAAITGGPAIGSASATFATCGSAYGVACGFAGVAATALAALSMAFCLVVHCLLVAVGEHIVTLNGRAAV